MYKGPTFFLILISYYKEIIHGHLQELLSLGGWKKKIVIVGGMEAEILLITFYIRYYDVLKMEYFTKVVS